MGSDPGSERRWALVDTHAHIDEESFGADVDDVLSRAAEQGVARIVTIGTTLDSSRRALALAQARPGVFAAVGIHPNYASQAAADDWERIVELSRAPRVVAVGETGLDRYWDYAPLDVQVDYFQRHMALSQQTQLPFIVHCREAESETIEQLRIAAARGALSGVMHSFAGTWETARVCLDLGLYISFSGIVTYKKSKSLRDLVRDVPRDRILVETDSPYLAPQPVRGKRNEPAFVRMTAAVVAELLEVELQEFARQTTENACRLFRFPAED
jgi:TatD DNase family protein